MHTIIIPLIFLILTSLSFQNKMTEDPYVIPIIRNISLLSEIKCSQFIDKFEYIKLETNDKCLIGNDYRALVLKDKIMISQYMHTYIFDRKTGKFEYELGRYGRGPGEYQTSFIAFNYTDLIVYSIGWKNNMLMYKLDGRYLGNFSIPFQKGGMEDPSLISGYCDLQNSNIVGYSLNILGTETKLLTIFNQKGEVIKVYPNKNIYPKRPLKSIDLTEGKFFRFGNNTFFKEKYNDTVFKVTDKSLIPHIIFEMGNYTVPYKYKWWTTEERQKSNFIFVNDIFENNAWIYILINNNVSDFFVLFNKKTLKLSVNKNGEGIPNDIDNFVKFKPEFIDSEGNLVAVVSALEINKWFKDNSSKISDGKIGLQNIEITQNPVIMIGRTKNN